MKQLIHGLSWVILTIAIIWCVKSDFDWEPLTALITSVIAIISTFDFEIKAGKLVGTWRATVENSGIHTDTATVYGYDSHFAGVSKILQFPGLPHFCKLYICYSGDYQIKDKSIHHNYSKIEVLYNSAFPNHIISLFMNEMRKNGTEEIIHIDETKLMVKTNEGTTVTAFRQSKKVEPDYLEKFVEELEK